MAGIYFHIPFCKRPCAYCDFFKSFDLRPMPALLDAMHRELEHERNYLHDTSVRTIYFGGGTPSLCPPERIGALIGDVRALFDCHDLGETTLEANPDDLTPDRLDAWLRAGVNRLSLGIQSFDDGALQLMNRRHTAAQARTALQSAREAGFGNITADLIFGIPGFGIDTLRRSTEELLSLGVQHISAYHLTIEPGTAFGRRAARGGFAPVDEEVSEEEFACLHEMLTAAGYEHYEVSNYALQGFRARHNSAYWTGDEYLGIGPGAHSYNGEERRWGAASIEGYLASPRYGTERLTERDRYNEYLMTSLRTARGIETDTLAARFGERRLHLLLREAQRWLEAGVLHEEEGRLAIPPEKFLVSDAVIESLFET